MTSRWFKVAGLAAFGATLLAAAVPATAQSDNWPIKPIRWIVPFAPGTSDILARIVAQRAAETLGQPIVVETRPGAGGNIGAAAVAQAPADGYTLLLGTIATHGVNPSLYAQLPYDAQKSFVPVAFLAFAPNVLVVNPSLPVKSVKEFLDYAKKNPGVTYGSAGAGTSMHMAGALFQVMSGAAMTHVPYKGTSEAVLAVARGDVQAMFSNLPPALPMIKDGRVRAIAYTTPARLDGMPELPNIGEAGLTGYDVSVWFGLFAPAGTPAPVVARLAREFRAALGDAAVRDKLVAQGYLLRPMDTAEFGNFVKGEIAKWGKVVRETGAKVE